MSYHIDLDLDFKRNPHKGLYIALEGIDGSGKTTQVPLLKERLESEGREVVVTREPRKEGMVKDVLDGNTNLPPEAYQYLFTIDRILHHRDLVLPALKRGAVVITDRCFWSAISYGTWDLGKDSRVDAAKQIMISQGILAMQIQFTVPDITFYLDLKPAKAIERLGKYSKKEIYDNSSVVTIVSRTYEWLVAEFPKEFSIIDATKSIDEVTNDMVRIVDTHPKLV